MKTFLKILIIFSLQLICIQQNSFGQDTIAISKTVVKPSKIKFKPEPLKATMMAVSFPGLGQVYNRKLWKIPLVYAGFGVALWWGGQNATKYTRYMKAYQDFTDTNPLTQSYLTLLPGDPAGYDPVLYPKTAKPATTSYYKDGMLRLVDYYKRYRDLSYIGMGVWYLVSILDANVDASLFNYDVSDNLNIAIFPVQLPLPGGFTGAGLNVGMRITF